MPSLFMREVGLRNYEPGAIETVRRDQPVPVADLLAGASSSDDWLRDPDESLLVDTAVCVFTPNRVANPAACSLLYLGLFEYSTERFT